MWVFVVREIAQVYYNARDEGPITNDIARLRKSYGFVEATENTFLLAKQPVVRLLLLSWTPFTIFVLPRRHVHRDFGSSDASSARLFRLGPGGFGGCAYPVIQLMEKSTSYGSGTTPDLQNEKLCRTLSDLWIKHDQSSVNRVKFATLQLLAG